MLHQWPLYSAVPFINRTQGPRNQGMEIEMAPFIVISSDPLGEFILLVSVSIGSVSLQILIAREMLLP